MSQCISKELQHTDDDATIKTILQFLDPSQWSSLEESARLRTENRLIRSLESGIYLKASSNASPGGLRPGDHRYFHTSPSKMRLLEQSVSRLASSSRSEQDYAYQFFFTCIDDLADKPTRRLENILIKGLQAGDDRFSNALNFSLLWADEKWSPELTQAVDKFQTAESTPDLTDVDVLF